MRIRSRLSGRFVLVALLLCLCLTAVTRFIAITTVRAAGGASLTVRVIGARNAKGAIRAAVFRDAKGFPNDTSDQTQADHPFWARFPFLQGGLLAGSGVRL